MTFLRSGENATQLMNSKGHFRVLRCAPLTAFHKRSDLSAETEIMRVPSVENDTERTASLCPSSVLKCAPLIVSHKRMLPSNEPDRICLPFGENCTEETRPECPSTIRELTSQFRAPLTTFNLDKCK